MAHLLMGSETQDTCWHACMELTLKDTCGAKLNESGHKYLLLRQAGVIWFGDGTPQSGTSQE